MNTLINNILALIKKRHCVHIWVQNITDHPLYDYILYHKNATGFLTGDDAKKSFDRAGVAGIKFVGDFDTRDTLNTKPSFYILLSSYINVTVELNEYEFKVNLMSCIDLGMEISIDGNRLWSNDKNELSNFVVGYL